MKKLSLVFVTVLAFASWFFFPAETATTYSPEKDRGEASGGRVIASATSDKPVSIQMPKAQVGRSGEALSNPSLKAPLNPRDMIALARAQKMDPVARKSFGSSGTQVSKDFVPFSSPVQALKGYQFFQGVRAFTDASKVPEDAVVISQGSKMWIAASDSFKKTGVVFEGASSPVFVSERDQSTRVPTGTLSLKLKEFGTGEIDSILKDYNFSKVGEVALVKLLEVRVPESSDFVAILDRLSKDARVDSTQVGFHTAPPRLK